jgi:GH24 family phage-related lysozyme (muramidase)
MATKKPLGEIFKEVVLGDERSQIKEYIRGHEGTVAGVYNDHKGNKTFGVGHLMLPGEKPGEMDPEQQFDKDIDIHIATAKRLFPKYQQYPIDVKKALVSGTFRGEFQKGQKTVDYINTDQWDKVPAEYINRKDYKESKNPKNKIGGVAKRMDENAGIFKKHAEKVSPAKLNLAALNLELLILTGTFSCAFMPLAVDISDGNSSLSFFALTGSCVICIHV